MHKVVINHSTQYAGSQVRSLVQQAIKSWTCLYIYIFWWWGDLIIPQGPSASAYVTYVRGEDALRAIQSVNNISVDGRTLRASLGTTKYCSHFMKNQSCPKPDCMYLHEIGMFGSGSSALVFLRRSLLPQLSLFVWFVCSI